MLVASGNAAWFRDELMTRISEAKVASEVKDGVVKNVVHVA